MSKKLRQVESQDYSKYNNRLSHIDKERIVSLIASFRKPQEIIEEMRPLQVTTDMIIYYRSKHHHEISIAREEWLARLSDEPYANKRYRLNKLSELIDIAEQEFATCEQPVDRQRWHKRITDTVEQIRNELEGTRIQVAAHILHTYDDSQLIEEAREVLALKEA